RGVARPRNAGLGPTVSAARRDRPRRALGGDDLRLRPEADLPVHEDQRAARAAPQQRAAARSDAHGVRVLLPDAGAALGRRGWVGAERGRHRARPPRSDVPAAAQPGPGDALELPLLAARLSERRHGALCPGLLDLALPGRPGRSGDVLEI